MAARRILIAVLLLGNLLRAPCAEAHEDIPPDQGAAGLYHALLQLKTTLKVMHIVAHPDDEDGAMLTYCSRGLGAQTMLFSVTRGEGGANLISKHAFDELGILRTLEHAESAKYYGVSVEYSSAADYGYSKTLEEAIAHWGKDERVLKELVSSVRSFQPDIIVSRFRGDARDGHGHHQFAGVLAQEAFKAAAAADRFPDAKLQPWQTPKLYANLQPDWRPDDKDAWTVALPTGEFNSVLGRSYSQIARYGLGFQRSQGFTGHDGLGGERFSYYRLTKTAIPDYAPKREESFTDGLDTSIVGLKRYAGETPPDWIVSGLAEMQRCVDRAWADFDPLELDAVAPALIDGYKAAQGLIDEMDRTKILKEMDFALAQRIMDKQSQFHVALRRSLGIELDVDVAAIGDSGNSDDASPGTELMQVIPGQKVQVTFRVVHRSKLPVRLAKGHLFPVAGTEHGFDNLDLSGTPIEYNKPWTKTVRIQLADDAPLTRPPWRRSSIDESIYEGEDFRGMRREMAPWGSVFLSVNGLELVHWAPFRSSFHHPEYGELTLPLEIVPRVSVAIVNAHAIILRGRREHQVNVILRHGAIDASEGAVQLRLPDGWSAEPTEQSFSLSKSDEMKTCSFTVHAPESLDEGDAKIEAVATCAGKEYSEGFETITARDLGRMNYYRPAEQHLHVVDVKVPAGLQVGYVMGAGDEIPAALAQLGIAMTLLDTTELARGDLQRFDTIMIGIRAYAVREDLIAANARLLDYVHNGGRLVVHYQTPEFDHDFGPYPYKMGRNPEEVSEEDSAVTLLTPEHPLFTTPNQITAADFAGWFEQRGSKFLQSWDEQYQPLLECHDQGQAEQRGGLLVARYGEGTYIYSAYALYRQLPQGVPGAYRLLANLAAVGKESE